jgi:glycosyltransferase involved in cell wall biosynthesis
MGLNRREMTRDELVRLFKRFSNATVPIIYNVNQVDEAAYGKRALLIYLVIPFLIKDDDPLFCFHQNLRRCKRLANLLHELGYIVDVADGRNLSVGFTKDYDLILSDKADLKGMNTTFRSDAVTIFIATTDYHGKHNRSLQRRHDMLFERRQYKLSARRIYSETIPFVIKSDAIIGVGNEFSANSWREVFHGPLYPFNNCGYKGIRIPDYSKDFECAKRSFLYFASTSQMQKGLDLLLEVFPRRPDLHLYVCSPFEFETDFRQCYFKELYETPNIHSVGWVEVNSRQFYELIDKCAYIILPTCSEGQAGSVVHCMCSGLIPIVTAEAGIDTGEFGITLSEDSLEEIERVIIEASGMPGAYHREQFIKTRREAEERFSEEALKNRLRSIMTRIISNASANKGHELPS